MSTYKCPVCESTDPRRWVRCEHPGCPDGRDRKPVFDRLYAIAIAHKYSQILSELIIEEIEKIETEWREGVGEDDPKDRG